MTKHICDAMVVCCIDFRFQGFIRRFTDKVLKGKKFDLLSYAGSTKDLSVVEKQVNISVKLHEIKNLYLIHHEECGAYGKLSTRQRHEKDLLKARKKIEKVYPDLKIHLFYLTLTGKFIKVD